MKVNQDLSILLWLRKQRKDETGKVPVCVRLTINGVRAQFSLGIKVLPSQFNTDSGSVKGKSEESKMINNQLEVSYVFYFTVGIVRVLLYSFFRV